MRMAELAVRSRPAAGRVQRGAGLRPHGRQGAGAAHGRGRHRLHRLHAPPASSSWGTPAQSNLKRVSLECGGKSPNIVMADCRDLDRAGGAAAYGDLLQPGRDVLGRFAAGGARGAIKDAVLEKVAKVGRETAPGDPLDPATQARRHRRYAADDSGAGLHRRRAERGRRACSRWAASARAATAAAATSSRRCSTA